MSAPSAKVRLAPGQRRRLASYGKNVGLKTILAHCGLVTTRPRRRYCGAAHLRGISLQEREARTTFEKWSAQGGPMKGFSVILAWSSSAAICLMLHPSLRSRRARSRSNTLRFRQSLSDWPLRRSLAIAADPRFVECVPALRSLPGCPARHRGRSRRSRGILPCEVFGRAGRAGNPSEGQSGALALACVRAQPTKVIHFRCPRWSWTSNSFSW
jgi:hypothetical protein